MEAAFVAVVTNWKADEAKTSLLVNDVLKIQTPLWYGSGMQRERGVMLSPAVVFCVEAAAEGQRGHCTVSSYSEPADMASCHDVFELSRYYMG